MPRAQKPKSSSEEDTKPYPSTPPAPPSKPKATTSPTKKAAVKWSREDKMNILKDLLESSTPDWEAMSKKFEGRTAIMVKDQWRKTLYPALLKTGSIDGSAGGAKE